MKNPFDLLDLYARFGLERKVSLRSPEAFPTFLEDMRGQLDSALKTPTLLYGQRTAAMFMALVIALGRYSLLKPEDNGRIYPIGAFRTPDFRLVLEDGEQWLVEVKNIYEKDPGNQVRQVMTPDYFASLNAYAKATGATLKLAIFWARWGIWTLVSPENLLNDDGYLNLDILRAINANEMHRLGDRTIGTRPPLRLRIVPDFTKSNIIDGDGVASFTIGEVVFLCENRILTSSIEKEIAWVLVNFGEWLVQDAETAVIAGRLEFIEFTWEPEERCNEGFEMIGTLSRIFSRYYAQQTIEDGEVIQIEADPRPDWFAPLTARDYTSDALPLWLFEVHPSNT